MTIHRVNDALFPAKKSLWFWSLRDRKSRRVAAPTSDRSPFSSGFPPNRSKSPAHRSTHLGPGHLFASSANEVGRVGVASHAAPIRTQHGRLGQLRAEPTAPAAHAIGHRRRAVLVRGCAGRRRGSWLQGQGQPSSSSAISAPAKQSPGEFNKYARRRRAMWKSSGVGTDELGPFGVDLGRS